MLLNDFKLFFLERKFRIKAGDVSDNIFRTVDFHLLLGHLSFRVIVKACRANILHDFLNPVLEGLGQIRLLVVVKLKYNESISWLQLDRLFGQLPLQKFVDLVLSIHELLDSGQRRRKETFRCWRFWMKG